MFAPTMDCYLPQVARAEQSNRSSQPSSSDTAENVRFDDVLQSASEKPAPVERDSEPDEQAPAEKTETKPEDKQTEKTDTNADSTGESTESDAAKLVVAEPFFAMLSLQETVEMETGPAQTEIGQAVISVKVSGPEQSATGVAAEDAPVEQAGAAKPEFSPQLQAPRAAEASTQVADTNLPRETTQASEGTNVGLFSRADTPVEEEVTITDTHAGQSDTAKREPAKSMTPTAPAPDNSASGQQNTLALNAVEQFRADVRQADAAGSVAGAPAEGAGLPVEDSQVVGQVVRGASMMVSQGRTSIRVQLRPPELGTIRIEIASDRGNVIEARIVAERDEVRQLIERNLPQLRESLSAMGVEIGGFDVSAQNSGRTPFEESTGSDNNRTAWDGAEPEDEQLLSASSGPVRGVNRSTSAYAIDYVV